MSDHLTPPERETVILLSGADDVARISTHQRRITKLRKNTAAREIADLNDDADLAELMTSNRGPGGS